VFLEDLQVFEAKGLVTAKNQALVDQIRERLKRCQP
jgi:hypothetical protein